MHSLCRESVWDGTRIFPKIGGAVWNRIYYGWQRCDEP